MRDLIEKARQKPKEARDRIAFASAAGVTAVIFAGWLAVSHTQFSMLAEVSNDIQPAGAFSGLINQIKERTSDLPMMNQESEPAPTPNASSTIYNRSTTSPSSVSLEQRREVRIATSTATSS